MIPKIFIVEDNPMYAAALEQTLAHQGYEITCFYTGEDLLRHLHNRPHIVTLDHNLPDIEGMDLLQKIKKDYPDVHVIYISAQEDVNVVVSAYREGASNYIVKNENALVELKQAVRNLRNSIELRQEVEVLKEELDDRRKYDKIVGDSSAMMKVLKLIQRVEKTDSLVLITGESGTGKELVAEAIHMNSERRRKPYVAVNLAAIPMHLVEDELFGHEKGAFTGAVSRRIGKFEEAEGGTIFLDEIGEMDVNLQSKLLRVLQEGSITRLGSNKVIKLNVRVIVATNRNLSEQVKQGRFREDLYYRIQGFLIHLPALRDRGKDVLVLARHFLEMFSKKYRMPLRSLSAEAEEALMKHHWPGNVRELIAMMDRCVLMSEQAVLEKKDLIFSDTI